MPVGSDSVSAVRRVNLGCGPMFAAHFINCDIHIGGRLDVCCDLTRGLPFGDASIDSLVAVHLLQDLEWSALKPALRELHRVLRPGGWLRLLVPDLDRAIDAYRRGDHAYFYIRNEEARSLGAKLVTQIVWYGSVRTPMTFDFLNEWLRAADFGEVRRMGPGQTLSGDALLPSLDNRPRESLIVEARR